jgi:hypothetical protein
MNNSTKNQENTVIKTQSKVEFSPKGVSPKKAEGFTPSLDASTTAIGERYPNFRFHGGPVIHTHQLYALFVGNWNSAVDQNRASRIRQFLSDFLNSKYMNILSQYGCGNNGNLANSIFIQNSVQDLTGDDIHNIIQTSINNHQLPEPINNSIAYILFLDNDTAVHDESVKMCEPETDTGFGYHYHFITKQRNKCPFAVVPGLVDSCLVNTCSNDHDCSLHLSQTQEQRQTQVASHELSEMFSNPFVDTDKEGWSNPIPQEGNENDDSDIPHENGDICNGNSATITVGSNTWNVQRMYSKWHDMKTNGANICMIENPDPLPSQIPP